MFTTLILYQNKRKLHLSAQFHTCEMNFCFHINLTHFCSAPNKSLNVCVTFLILLKPGDLVL